MLWLRLLCLPVRLGAQVLGTLFVVAFALVSGTLPSMTINSR